ncbi:MAG: DUF418 domain-containing protein, partial [Sphingomonadales bacterium]
MSIDTRDAPEIAPVAKAARVASLDVLRGIAVLGILMMNITAFGLLPHAYANPFAGGGTEGANRIAYMIISVLFEGTMRGIFSLLFGASIVLLTERMERGGAGIMAAEVHFRRMSWMLLFGIIHWTLMLWWGEILFNYAMCGLLLFSVRKLNPRTQLIAALLILVAAGAWQVRHYHKVEDRQIEAAAAEQAKAAGQKLSDKQAKAIERWTEQLAHYMPTAED